MSKQINVVDLFAGPGGLGEGFSSFGGSKGGSSQFHIRVSVEKEASAHKTLTLRALYRQLVGQGREAIYHQYVSGDISKEELVATCSKEWSAANTETLGAPTALGEQNETIHDRLRVLKRERKKEPWIVIGGPPCQAYSLVGRARNKGITGYTAESDSRHYLYKEYLNVLSIVQPDVFVMENVKGILTSKLNGERIFPAICKDLADPDLAINSGKNGKTYRIHSFVVPYGETDLLGGFEHLDTDFVIRSEQYGVPQTRHRVILLGVDVNISRQPRCLPTSPSVPVGWALTGLPPLRSKLSKEVDGGDAWESAIQDQIPAILRELKKKKELEVSEVLRAAGSALKSRLPTISSSYRSQALSRKMPAELSSWLLRDRPVRVLNHESRGHIRGDLGRYLFCSSWAKAKGVTPKADEFPASIVPAHANWKSGHFADRFRVQTAGRPATTVTSHISKDGHYFIHPDPTQCRSLTVREAARIQTFPDNYFFEGNRTQQYVQVGNAVPPFLALQLAGVVYDLLR